MAQLGVSIWHTAELIAAVSVLSSCDASNDQVCDKSTMCSRHAIPNGIIHSSSIPASSEESGILSFQGSVQAVADTERSTGVHAPTCPRSTRLMPYPSQLFHSSNLLCRCTRSDKCAPELRTRRVNDSDVAHRIGIYAGVLDNVQVSHANYLQTARAAAAATQPRANVQGFHTQSGNS